jgi:hypothetical protein
MAGIGPDASPRTLQRGKRPAAAAVTKFSKLKLKLIAPQPRRGMGGDTL